MDQEQDDPMVITIELENFAVKKVLIDQGSSVDILYWVTYKKLQLPIDAMVPYDEPIDLHTVLRKRYQTKTILVRLLVVEAHTSYNVLLG